MKYISKWINITSLLFGIIFVSIITIKNQVSEIDLFISSVVILVFAVQLIYWIRQLDK